MSDNCQFFVQKCKDPRWANKRNKDGARRLLLVAVITGDSWAKIRCPYCDYRKNINVYDLEHEVKLDNNAESLIQSFKTLGKDRANKT